MLDFEAAQKLIVEQNLTKPACEYIDLFNLNKRVLAEDIFGLIDVPPADNSSMDGYAISSTDIELAQNNGLPIQDAVFAGQAPMPLKDHHAMRIFTGGLLPNGADTIVIQENCTLIDNGQKRIVIDTPAKSGDFVRYRGEDMAKNKLLIKSGTRLHAGHIGVLAAQGMTKAKVFKTPIIGILTTGDELIQPGNQLPPAAIYDSNTAMLFSLCQNLGISDIKIRHVKDDLDEITNVIAELNQSCDVVLTVGGVSVGDKDYIKPALAKLGAELDLWRVNMKPGKPVALAKLDSSILIGLPGNPVSTFVVFTLLASPLIRKLQGCTQVFKPIKQARIKLKHAIKNGSRTDFIRVKIINATLDADIHVEPYHLQSSAAISSVAWADGLARIPVNCTVQSGDFVELYEFTDHLA